MIDLDNQTTLIIDIDGLEKVANILTKRDIELIVVENDKMQEFNLNHRGKDSSTDVLSFPIEGITSDMPLGSIIISSDFVKESAKSFTHSTHDELLLLFIHGSLHLLGFDHEVDNGEMRDKEREIIELFDLPKSLIIRTEEF